MSVAARASRWLRAPFLIAFGPAFELESRSSGRRAGTYVTRLIVGVLVLGIAALGYLGSLSEAQWNDGPAQLQSMQGLAPVVAVTVIWTQFVLLGLLAPVATASAICDEHRKRTFPALLTTPLTASHIVVGKLFGRVAELLVLTLLPAPLLLALRVFGGLRAEPVLGAAAVIGASVLSGAAIGMLASVRARRSSTASTVAMSLSAAIHLVPLLLVMLLAMGAAGMPAWVGRVLEFCPLTAMAVITAELFGETSGAPMMWSAAWRSAALAHVGIAVLATLLAIVMLRPSIRGAEREEGGGGDAGVPDGSEGSDGSGEAAARAPGGVRTRAAGRAAARAATRARGRSRTVSGNPVLWRELRAGTRQSAMMKVIGFFALLGLAAWLYSQTMDEEEVHVAVAVLGTVCALFHAVSSASGAISGEREARTLDALLVTPMRPRRILVGKLAGALRKLWLFPLAVVTVLVVAGMGTGTLRPVYLLLAPLIALPPMVFITATGLLFSLVFKRPLTATAANVMLGGGMWVGLFILGGVLSWLTTIDVDEVFLPAFVINPMFQHGELVDSLSKRGRPEFQLAPSLSDDVGLGGYVVYAVAFASGYLAAAWGAVELAARSFNHRLGRSS